MADPRPLSDLLPWSSFEIAIWLRPSRLTLTGIMPTRTPYATLLTRNNDSLSRGVRHNLDIGIIDQACPPSTRRRRLWGRRGGCLATSVRFGRRAESYSGERAVPRILECVQNSPLSVGEIGEYLPVSPLPSRNQSGTGERTAICSEDQYSRRLAMSWPSKTRMATSLIRLRTFWTKSSNWASHSTMAVFPSR